MMPMKLKAVQSTSNQMMAYSDELQKWKLVFSIQSRIAEAGFL